MKAENILIRGNEGIQVEARSLNITTKTILALNTTVCFRIKNETILDNFRLMAAYIFLPERFSLVINGEPYR